MGDDRDHGGGQLDVVKLTVAIPRYGYLAGTSIWQSAVLQICSLLQICSALLQLQFTTVLQLDCSTGLRTVIIRRA